MSAGDTGVALLADLRHKVTVEEAEAAHAFTSCQLIPA